MIVTNKKWVRVLVLLFLPGMSSAQDLSGAQVLDNVSNAIDASSARIDIRMVLHSASGSTRERALEVFAKDSDGGSMAFMEFTAPADVEGTSFLSLDRKSAAEEMYLYMPVLGSVRKIAGSQKNGSFVGSDFTYNDMSILGGGGYSVDYEAEVIEYTEEIYTLKLTPVNDEIEYASAKMWVSSSNWMPTKIEFFEENGLLSKTLTNEQMEQVNGYWTARQVTMTDNTRGTKTVIYLESIKYDVVIDDGIFTTRQMRR